MKRLMALFLSLLLLAALCACGKGGEKEALPPFSQLADQLLDSGAFTEALSPVAAQTGCLLYGLEPTVGTEIWFSMSSGATGEEIAAFRCADAATAELTAEACRARLSQQAELYASYKPEEVPKLEGALLLRLDNVVLLCVAADSGKAQAVLDRYF